MGKAKASKGKSPGGKANQKVEAAKKAVGEAYKTPNKLSINKKASGKQSKKVCGSTIRRCYLCTARTLTLRASLHWFLFLNVLSLPDVCS